MFSMTLEMIKIVASNSHALALKRLELDRRKLEFEEVKAGLRHMQDGEFEDRSEDSEMGLPLEEVSAIPFPPQEVTPSPQPTATTEYVDEQLTDDEMDALYSFLSTWLENFDAEGPQPDRAGLIPTIHSGQKDEKRVERLKPLWRAHTSHPSLLKGNRSPKEE